MCLYFHRPAIGLCALKALSNIIPTLSVITKMPQVASLLSRSDYYCNGDTTDSALIPPLPSGLPAMKISCRPRTFTRREQVFSVSNEAEYGVENLFTKYHHVVDGMVMVWWKGYRPRWLSRGREGCRQGIWEVALRRKPSMILPFFPQVWNRSRRAEGQHLLI